MTLDQDRTEAVDLFSKELWVDQVDAKVEEIAGRHFLKFIVTRRAPIYTHALQRVQTALSDDNLFKGRIEIELRAEPVSFPESIESSVLEGMIGRTSRTISEGELSHAIAFVPFHNREENKVIQPATHLILGRRGVGKSTLIGKAVEVLRRRKNLCVTIDLQAYAHREDKSIQNDLLSDVARGLHQELAQYSDQTQNQRQALIDYRAKLDNGTYPESKAILDLKQIIKDSTSKLNTDFFVFLDDFHLFSTDAQPKVLSALHGSLKGARGWLKVAGITSLVRYYDQSKRIGLQVPGDAQVISLDLTLADPHAAESHLKSILANYLAQVGITNVSAVIGDTPFKRLVWANAGVVRDFLQMFAIALVSARRSGRKKIALSDVNLSIGELGKQKISDLEQDVRNESEVLEKFLERLEEYCLNSNRINAFLIRQETSELVKQVQTLSDLRVVHLIHQSITPHKAGERYEAYMLDYSLFVGFRRKRNIHEVHPKHGIQFQVKELRKLPVFSNGTKH